jgi:hypothetical protein
MLTCSTGFPTLFLADANVVDVTYANTSIIALLKLMDAAMAEDYADIEDNTFFLSRADYLAYGNELEALNHSGSAFVEGKPLFYNGRPVQWLPQMPASRAFYTSAENLVVAFDTDGLTVEAERSARKAGYDVIINFNADFGYFNGKQVVLASV